MKRPRLQKSVILQAPKPSASVLDKTPTSSSDSKAKKPKKQYHNWNESEIQLLTAAVEARPVLWAVECRNSKHSVRDQAWEEVFSLFNGISPTEVKKKWASLRKIRNKSSKWVKYTLFLDKETHPATSEKWAEVEVSDPSSTQALDSYMYASQPKEHPHMQTALTSSRVSSSTPCRNTSGAVLLTPDPNLSFCEYLLAELNMLSDTESRHLRGMLMQVVSNFDDTLEAQPTC